MGVSRSPLLLAGLALLAGCGEKMPEQKPTPPDMSGVALAYEQPTLTLEAANILGISESTLSLKDTIDRAQALVDLVDESVRNSIEAAVEPKAHEPWSPGYRAQGVEGEGFLHVHRICPGWEASPSPSEANGALDLTVGFTEAGIDPVIWGTVSSCQLLAGGVRAQISGAVNAYVGEGLTFDAFGTSAVLIELNVDFASEGESLKLNTDFRLTPPGMLEYRVFVNEQFAVYFEESSRRGYRAANGIFSCDFNEKTCSTDSGSTLSW